MSAVIRLLLACVLLLALRPTVVEASVCAPDAEERHSFAALDGGSERSVVRSPSGADLLELSVRVNSRISAGRPRGPLPLYDDAPLQSELLLATRSRLVIRRELRLECSSSPFRVYLPYYAIPPPFLL